MIACIARADGDKDGDRNKEGSNAKMDDGDDNHADKLE